MTRRRWFCPEVVQTSAADCGPACLKALLEGHGIAASYGRLREACRTDVDGSSIDTLEQLANDLGLAATQVMVPVEHLTLPSAGLCPALVVVRQPNGMTHFVVAWRLWRGVVQLMDPATGRRWTSPARLCSELYVHETDVDAAAFRDWATSDAFVEPLRQRMRQLGLRRDRVVGAIEARRSAPGWRPMATLDAATRLCAALVHEGGLDAGRDAERTLLSLVERAADAATAPTATIPADYWTALAATADATTVRLRGAVLLTIAGVRATNGEAAHGAAAPPPILRRVLTEPPARPGRELVQLLVADGWLAPFALVALLAFAAGGVLVEALLFRALFGIGAELAVPEQRLVGVAALLAFVALLLLLELPIWSRTLSLGRRLEGRVRLRLLGRLTRVHDRYFKSRLVSDMAERCHRLHELRTIGELGAELLRAVFGMLFTAAGIVWLAPDAALPVVVGVTFCLLVPLVAQPLLTESDLRLRNHAGGLLRFHLDALLGLVPLRAHAAGRNLQGQHRALLAHWSEAGMRLQRRVVGIEAVQSLASFALAAVVLASQGARPSAAASSLLLLYWVLSLPALGQQIGSCARRYPALRSITLRFLELIGAGGDDAERVGRDAAASAAAPANGARTGGVAIRLEHVSVKAAGLTLLADLDVEIAAGSHVAIVGASGAGKSSLVGLLLGVHEPIGRLTIDGVPLDRAALDSLRATTAWVDPGVQLWNKSLLENLCYGGDPIAAGAVGPVIDRAAVAPLLDSLPDGMQTRLGEGGTLLSGGEGQRLRFSRAAVRGAVRLAILDEPFRGLTREVRADLLGYARELWRDATLLCVTHDLDATLGFDRVLVVEGGRIAEHGAPETLAASASRYAQMLAAERAAGAEWSQQPWRRLRLERGQLAEVSPESAA